jgi:hypothetical protein
MGALGGKGGMAVLWTAARAKMALLPQSGTKWRPLQAGKEDR